MTFDNFFQLLNLLQTIGLIKGYDLIAEDPDGEVYSSIIDIYITDDICHRYIVLDEDGKFKSILLNRELDLPTTEWQQIMQVKL